MESNLIASHNKIAQKAGVPNAPCQRGEFSLIFKFQVCVHGEEEKLDYLQMENKEHKALIRNLLMKALS